MGESTKLDYIGGHPARETLASGAIQVKTRISPD